MLIDLNKVHYPVTTLGYGERIGIWTQGCSIRCPGCVSQDTWADDTERGVPISTLIALCKDFARNGVDGITISGGEPFDQANALRALVRELCKWRAANGLVLDILVYSGRPHRYLAERYADILCSIDVLIPEPYVETSPEGKIWRGSGNQPLVLLSELAHKRYGDMVDKLSSPKRMQYKVDNGRIWFIGIPSRRDTARLEECLKKNGLGVRSATWRT